MSQTPNFAQRVWKTLYAIDLKKSQLVRQKNGLDYLAWADAWQIIMEQFPESSFECSEPNSFNFAGANKTTCEVSVTVTIREGENSLSRTMWLPVISFKNEAIDNPDAYAINKAKMRCLVKCLALFGLGLNLYTKDDAPEAKTLDLDELAFEINQAANLEKAKEAARAVWHKASKAQRDKIVAMLDEREAAEKARQESQDAAS